SKSSELELSQSELIQVRESIEAAKSGESALVLAKKNEFNEITKALAEAREQVLENGKQLLTWKEKNDLNKAELEKLRAENTSLATTLASNNSKLELSQCELTQVLEDIETVRSTEEAIRKELEYAKIEVAKQQAKVAEISKTLTETGKSNDATCTTIPETSMRQKLEIFNELEASLRKENKLLSEKIVEVTDELKKTKETTRDSEIVAFENQIKFLNSIIAQKQEKENHLMQELQRKEKISYRKESQICKAETRPRMYCDICEEFDKHETEDCPTQLMEESDIAEHSHYSSSSTKVKPPPREYCDNCEEFGHDTSACEKAKSRKDYTF
ncbi:unnamed protein product, partial [Auanema sp. JU1783]